MVYAVTVSVATHRFNEWLTWMLTNHIPDVLATGCFQGHRLWQHFDTEKDTQTVTIHYYCRSRADYEVYAVQSAPMLQREHTEKFQGDFTASRTLMEDVEPV